MSSTNVKVWNDNVHPFTQKFKGDTIHIPAKSFIEMAYDEAISFKGKPYPRAFDGMGQQDPKSYKMIRVEGAPKFDQKVTAYKSHVDGSLHPSQEALETYEEQFAQMQAKPQEGEVVKKKPAAKKAE